MWRAKEDKRAVKQVFQLRRICRKVRGAEGQALVEFAAVVPLLLLLAVLAMNFCGLIGAWIAVANAARAAADYASLGTASAGSPAPATSASLQNLIHADLASLPNLSSNLKQVCIQTNNNGTITTVLAEGTGCTGIANPPADTEVISGSAYYTDVAVDITYTYNSLFTGNSFLGLPLTVLPSSVHQRAVMRVENENASPNS